jgi:hypothetical protein
MSQSNIVVGCLLLAFLIFITVRGELPAYMKVVGLGSSQ